MDYNTEIPNVSSRTGEANDLYINDEQHIFTLSSHMDISEPIMIKRNLLAKETFIVGILKKDNQILLNSISQSNLYVNSNNNDLYLTKTAQKISNDSEEIMVFSLVGWEEDNAGQLTHWKFKANMNSNWYIDGCINIPVDSDLIIEFKSLTFQMF